MQMTAGPTRPIARALTAIALCLSAACAGDESADKTPLDAPAGSAATGTTEGALPAAAQAALAAGNEAYRAGRFDDALTEYNKAVAAAPASAAPYYGVLMVAQKTGNPALADSASSMIRKLSGEEASVHSGAPAASPHPPSMPPKTTP
jgi:Flp pilus assembly protein TadD